MVGGMWSSDLIEYITGTARGRHWAAVFDGRGRQWVGAGVSARAALTAAIRQARAEMCVFAPPTTKKVSN